MNLPQGFEASTIAHEIGHWVLHINPHEVERFLKRQDQGLETVAQPFLCRNAGSQKKAKSIEWQAQYFASCLLMPRFILEEKRLGRDLTNWHHLYRMKDELGVTISNLIHRLQQDLGWIHILPGSRQILLGDAAPCREKQPIR
ncbi:hypothetical protein WA1_43855 [Scytonema hofmannii PCC 7110]|uniref:IrrE N-terminal-like domain-containing protein n=1 Tax=Scytonema hofmannii PCC 7110 TaxID=128403 RepID=A0A139WW37_9CYAN|nr:hypothetical protein WA1_43855 [Scytonema hofmannii PCC 7110]